MGGGSWTHKDFVNYSATRGRTVDRLSKSVVGSYSTQEMFTSRSVDSALNPYGVIRECCDSADHPNSHPVILGIDVTGSMGDAAVEVAKKIGTIVGTLFDRVKDVQFMIMAIGDLRYDRGPIQVSQFESDVRIAEQLDKVWFEGGGGGNAFESYTAAWYFGLHCCKLDAWKRGEKGLIITTGDEPLNPYLPRGDLSDCLGISAQGDVETKDLFREASEKFNIFHIAVKDHSTSYDHYRPMIHSSWEKVLEPQHLLVSTLDKLDQTIIDIVESHIKSISNTSVADKPFVASNEVNGIPVIGW